MSGQAAAPRVDAEAPPEGFGASVLTGSLVDFAKPRGTDLLRRTESFFEWQNGRRMCGLWPYSRSLEVAPHSRAEILSDAGTRATGLNFASQDYLSLASHPAIAQAAERALRDLGPHSAGSAALLGNTRLSLELERALGEILLTEEVTLFPTGWGAGFGAIAALVRPDDHVIIDQLAHACLVQGAYAATKNVTRTDHLRSPREALSDIRSRDAKNGILVISEGLFSMDSDWPRINEVQSTCREYGATFLLDVAHDFGATGPGGTGQLGAQAALGNVDLVMGSFSKTFASNGGFLASHSPAVKQFVKYYGGPHIFSNALSPIQVGIVLEALRIVRSPEGDALRQSLQEAVIALRSSLATRQIECLGQPSPIVPVPVGNEGVARVAAKLLSERGVLANLAEFPAVPVGHARFRMQVMAAHKADEAFQAAGIVAEAIREAERLVESLTARPE